MSNVRRSDGLLEAEQVYALLDLIGTKSSRPAPDQLARELRVQASASISKTLNTIDMLLAFNMLDLVDGVAKLQIGGEWSLAKWHAEIGRSTATELAERIVQRGLSTCLQRTAEGCLWLDSMSLPGAHDGLSFWAIDFAVTSRERTTSRLWRVAESFESIFLDAARRENLKEVRRPITAKQLADRLEANALNGLLAEEWVLSQELERLKDHPLRDQIRRISDEDVSAGFDILSFSTSNALRHDLHIEVKSYSGVRRFFWSRNEVETAEALGEQYSLYLVDRSEMASDGYSAQIIKGPYSALFQTGLAGWTIREDSYECIGPPVSQC